MSTSYLMFVKCLEDEKHIRTTNYNHCNEGSHPHEITKQFLHSATQFLQMEGPECFYLHYVSSLE